MTKRTTKVLSLILAFCMVLGLLPTLSMPALADPIGMDGDASFNDKVTVTLESDIVTVGGSTKASAKATFTEDGETYDLNVTGTSWGMKDNNTSVADVAQDGTVTGKAAGTAVVVATCTIDDGEDGYTIDGEATITVTDNQVANSSLWVAKVDKTGEQTRYYASLKEAVEKAGAGETTITLNPDLTGAGELYGSSVIADGTIYTFIEGDATDDVGNTYPVTMLSLGEALTNQTMLREGQITLSEGQKITLNTNGVDIVSSANPLFSLPEDCSLTVNASGSYFDVL